MLTPVFLLQANPRGLPAPGCYECVQTSKHPRGTVFHAHHGLPVVMDTSFLAQGDSPSATCGAPGTCSSCSAKATVLSLSSCLHCERRSALGKGAADSEEQVVLFGALTSLLP